jgi:hypothetical protein
MISQFTIRIEVLENGFKVEVPDTDKIKEKQAKDKKEKRGDYPTYIGDCTKSYAAKTVPDVIKMVKGALSALPEIAYAESFAEAAKSMKGGL